MEPPASLSIRPYDVIRLIATLGRGEEPGEPALSELLAGVSKDPYLPLTLRATTSGPYRELNPSDGSPETLESRRRDLMLLQRLGLVPGDSRPAICLLQRVLETIESIADLAHSPEMAAHYERGRARGLGAIIPSRSTEEMAGAKATSAKALLAAAGLRFRPHHLLCMCCFYGRRIDQGLAPIAEDNLYEGIAAMQGNPEIPVTLVEGPCDICPPCPGFDPQAGVCRAAQSMGLRDELKDLQVLHLLGLEYGDTLPARDLLRRLFAMVTSTTQVCGYGTGVTTAPEWRVCGGPEGSAGYPRARKDGLGVEGAAP